MKNITGSILSTSLIFFLLLTLFAASGCADMNLFGNSAEEGGTSGPSPAKTEAEPYYPTDFKDVMIPGELKWLRESSMLIRTSSFAGGTLKFSGNVEINSLADFFTDAMTKNSWKLSGSAKYKNIMLAFSKPGKTCMVMIFDKLYLETEVYVYITENIAPANASSSSEILDFSSSGSAFE